jgi:tetratricopeptide (TPR) repeat protein
LVYLKGPPHSNNNSTVYSGPGVHKYPPKILWFQGPEDPKSFHPHQVLIKKGEVLELIGRWDAAGALFADSLETADRALNKEAIAGFQTKLGWMLHKKGDNVRPLELLSQARDHYLKTGQEEKLGAVLNKIGSIYNRQGDYQKALECNERSLDLGRKQNSRNAITIALNNLGNLYGDMGDASRSLECYQEGLALDEAAGDHYSASIEMGNMGWVYNSQGEFQKAAECWRRQAEWAELIGDKHTMSVSLGNMAALYLEQGDYIRGREYIERRLAIARELGDKKGLSISLSHLANLHRFTGENRLAWENFDQAIALAREINLKYYLAIFLEEKAELLYQMGLYPETDGCCQQAVEVARVIGKSDTLFRCRLLQAKVSSAGNKPEGLRQLEGMLDEHRQPVEQALVHYELFKLAGSEHHKRSALDLYRELYRAAPSSDVRDKLQELERD